MDAPSAVDGGAEYREIPLGAIVAEPQAAAHRVRRGVRSPSWSTRSASSGCCSPSSCGSSPDGYELIMGERRLAGRPARRAATRSRRSSGTPRDDAMLRDALLENIHRVQLNPLEEAAAYEQLLAEFGVTHDELADRIGRSRPVVTNMIRLLKLPVAVQRRVAAGVLSAGHARALLGLDDAGARRSWRPGSLPRDCRSARPRKPSCWPARRARRRRERRAGERAPGGDHRCRRPAVGPVRHPGAGRNRKRKGRIVVEFGSVEDLERIA